MKLSAWDLHFLRVEGGWWAADELTGCLGGQEAGQAGGSNGLKIPRRTLIFQFLKFASQMLSLSLNLASNFSFSVVRTFPYSVLKASGFDLSS